MMLSLFQPASHHTKRTYIGIAERTEPGVHVRQWLVLTDTFGTMHLHRPINHVEGHGGNGELGVSL